MDILRITSAQNPRVKAAARLRDHAAREEQGRIVIDGWREIRMARQADVELLEIYYNPERRDSTFDVRRELAGPNTVLIEVPDAVLAKIAFGGRNEGVIAVAATPQRSLPSLTASTAPLVLILEDLEKPGNIGAILRTAFAVGIDGLISLGRSGDLDNPNAIRASLGTVFSVPCCTATIPEVQQWLRKNALRVCAAKVDATRSHYEFDFTTPTAIVLGSEAKGLSAHWRKDDVVGVRIPMRDQADSLNVSVAAGVLLYEALRQRKS